MSIATIVRRKRTKLTNQHLADMALQAWQNRRDALKRGDTESAEAFKREALDLADQLS